MSNEIRDAEHKIVDIQRLAYFKEKLATVAITGNYGDLDGTPFWIGTQAEYEAQINTIPSNTVIFVVDDTGEIVAVNYLDVLNKPQVNHVVLVGDKTGAELGLVDAIPGKGLSTEDFTTDEKNKLSAVETNAQENVIEAITVNGTAQSVVNKTVALSVMTNAVNDLVYYYTKSETYTQAEVNALVSAIPKFAIKVVNALPTTDISTTTIYLLKTSETETDNLYTEYIYVDAKWEKLGTQTLDLSGYVTTTALNTALADYTTTTDMNTLLSGKVDKVTGKGLSTNDYTDTDKDKLAGIAAGAEANVQSDWTVSDSTSDAYIKNKPTLGTAAGKDVAATGNAAASQVVMGNDTRLSDARNAADVSAWAKAATKPTYTAAEVGLGNVVNTGDSDIPVANGTTKFTTGGAYIELAKKVDKVDGKGLSANDYTTTEKNKLGGIAAGAQVNVIESIKVNGTAQAVSGKAVDISVPTEINDLDDAWIGTAAELETEASSIPNDTMIVVNDDGGIIGKVNYATGVSNHPSINNIEVVGNKTGADLGLVDAVSGKGLSTNDYSDSEKAKVATLLTETEIQEQIINGIYEGTDLTIKFASEIAASPYNGDPWAWIAARTAAGNFSGIHIEDYIPLTIGYTYKAQIMGICTHSQFLDTIANKRVGNHIDWCTKEIYHIEHKINKVGYNNGTSHNGLYSRSPWVASDLYHWLNSLTGTVPNATTAGGGSGEAVDYTTEGVYYNLPATLKSVIIEKFMYTPSRYMSTTVLTDDNDVVATYIGKIWLPTEFEVYGTSALGGFNKNSICGNCIQYPLFAHNCHRIKQGLNGTYANWLLLNAQSGYDEGWCVVSHDGRAYSNAITNATAANKFPICFRTGTGS